jgi:hypothetical protein
MKKLNFNIPATDSGREVEEVILADYLASHLKNTSDDNFRKMMYWASALQTKEELQLDPEDLKLLTNFVEKNKMIPNWLKMNIIEILEA